LKLDQGASNSKELSELANTESFWQSAECNLALIVGFDQLSDASIPTRENRIISAPLPMFASRSGREEKQPVAVAIDSHADLILTHARSQLRPELIVREFILFVGAGAERHRESDCEHRPTGR